MTEPLKIEDVVSYCPETGIFRWKISRRCRYSASEALAGRVDQDGYRRIKFCGKLYAAHRVAWRIMTGEWPPRLIDHKNTNPSDNRWENLRLATSSQNQMNRSGSGKYPKGVSKNPKGGRFKAAIRKENVVHYLGSFDTPNLAGAAYAAAAKVMHGEFARTARKTKFAVRVPQPETADTADADSSSPASAGQLPKATS